MKSIFILFVFLLNLNAAMLLDTTKECIDSYYVSNSSIYYVDSASQSLKNSVASVSDIYLGYDYDSNTSRCNPSVSTVLGLTVAQFSFLTALTAILFFTLVYYALINLYSRG